MNGLTLKFFVLAFLVFIMTDMLWLGLIAKSLYLQYYEPWLRLKAGHVELLWWAALMLYLLFALSIIVFIIPLSQGSPYWAACYGAVLGGIIYGVYDFTCLAIFKDFPIGMGLIDWLWGIVLYSWSSFLTLYLGDYLK